MMAMIFVILVRKKITMKITDLKPNPNNPRIIKDDKFKKLVTSLSEFPEMMEKRPMVCVTDTDGKLYPLGGNMRLRALKELKYKEIPDSWVMLADEWSEEKRQEFTIRDNVSYGEWDFDTLANEWDVEELAEWGLDIPNFEIDREEINYSDKNKEIDVDDYQDEMILKLKYNEQEYNQVREALSKIAATPEQAVFILLKL
jgi:ParB-like chromosome segregation protein Spo0J